MTTSLKADYPIAIDFSGAQASGTVNIISNAPVYLAGTITQVVGQTSITAQGSITQATGASIEAKNLTLTATAGIGSTSQPLVANLAAGGVLNAQGGDAGVYLKLNSGTASARSAGPIPRASTDSDKGQVYISPQTFQGDQDPDGFSFYSQSARPVVST